MNETFYNTYYPILFKHDSICKKQSLIHPHFHPSIELLYCKNGVLEIEYWEANSAPKKLTLFKGSFAIIKPNIIHAQCSLLEDSEFYCLEIKNNLSKSANVFNDIKESNLGKQPSIAAALNELDNVSIVLDSSNTLHQLKKLSTFTIEKQNSNKNDLFYMEYYLNLLNVFLAIIKSVHQNKIPIKENLYVRLATTYINNHLFDNTLNIEQIAKATNISPSYLHTLFKQTFSKGVKQYVNELRVKQCINFLEKTNLSVEQIALKVGFKNYSSLYKAFLSVTKSTPKNYRDMINNQTFEFKNF